MPDRPPRDLEGAMPDGSPFDPLTEALRQLQHDVAALRQQTDRQDVTLNQLGQKVARHDVQLDVVEREVARVHQQLSEVLGEIRQSRENGQQRWEKVLTFMDELKGRDAQKADDRAVEQARLAAESARIAGSQVRLGRRSMLVMAAIGVASMVASVAVQILVHFVH